MSIDEICKKYGIRDYIINDDGTIDVDSNVDFRNSNLTELPLDFNKVTGYFNCGHNNLTTLKGSPKEVSGDFYCIYNSLTSLLGGPKKVGNSFNSMYNKLITLEGCPEYVGGNFFCQNNEIKDLDFIPEMIKFTFYCDENPIAWIFYEANIDFLKAFKSFKVLKDDVVNLKRLKYMMEIFNEPIYIDKIKKHYTIK
tara:strand:- start:44 stop:631 length:588 start_codon:yes stop_codon:yes gene_type:complete